MDLTPDERAFFERVQHVGEYTAVGPALTALTPDEIAQAAQLLDERGARQTCGLCDGTSWRWCFWRGGHGPDLVLTRTCERCCVIESFDAGRLFPADPIRARAEAWAPALTDLWESQGVTLSHADAVASLAYSAVWVFSSPAQYRRYDRWLREKLLAEESAASARFYVRDDGLFAVTHRATPGPSGSPETSER